MRLCKHVLLFIVYLTVMTILWLMLEVPSQVCWWFRDKLEAVKEIWRDAGGTA